MRNVGLYGQLANYRGISRTISPLSLGNGASVCMGFVLIVGQRERLVLSELRLLEGCWPSLKSEFGQLATMKY